MFSSRPEQAVAFYRALGVPLDGEDHEGGPLHWAADLGEVHLAVHDARNSAAGSRYRQSGSAFGGLFVDSLDDAVEALASIDAPIIQEHQERPWGCRIIAEDPDGRAFEVNQEGHCPRA